MTRLAALCLACACSAAAPDGNGAPAPRPTRTVVPAGREPARTPVPERAIEPREHDIDALVVELRALPPDPPPVATTNAKHYLVSNERRLDLYRPDVDGLGGVLLGVGSDQNYIVAGFVDPELLVVVDFDEKVVDLHAIHGALIRAADDADAFRALWTEAGRDEARAIVKAAFPERARAKALLELYDEARHEVDTRLRGLKKRYAELGIRTWLEDAAQWAIVKELHVRDRVVAIRGDFTKAGVLQAIAETLREHDKIVRVLYLSNIEQYFAYRKPFKDNMLALPFDERSLVLRTLPGRPAGFQYILQRGGDFQDWMRAPNVWTVYRMRGMAKGEHLVASERFFIEAPAPAASSRLPPPDLGGKR